MSVEVGRYLDSTKSRRPFARPTLVLGGGEVSSIAHRLYQTGFPARTVTDIRELQMEAKRGFSPDIVLVDFDRHTDGVSQVQEVYPQRPIVALTNQRDNSVPLYDSGADYVHVGNNQVRVLAAHMTAILRRTDVRDQKEAIEEEKKHAHLLIKSGSIDVANGVAVIDGERILFSKKMLGIIQYLAQDPGNYREVRGLVQAVLDNGDVRMLRIMVQRLRNRLHDTEKIIIETRRNYIRLNTIPEESKTTEQE